MAEGEPKKTKALLRLLIQEPRVDRRAQIQLTYRLVEHEVLAQRPKEWAEPNVAQSRRQGYRLTMHCDVDQENSVEHIWQCLDEIGVERVDHGVNALEDAALIKEINSRRLGLTVCPISNSYVTDGLKAIEIKSMLDAGVRATINSDDPAYFPGYMNENLIAVQGAVQLTRERVHATGSKRVRGQLVSGGGQGPIPGCARRVRSEHLLI